MKLKKNGNESTITETKKNLINNQCDIIEKNIKQNNFYVYALVNPITNAFYNSSKKAINVLDQDFVTKKHMHINNYEGLK